MSTEDYWHIVLRKNECIPNFVVFVLTCLYVIYFLLFFLDLAYVCKMPRTRSQPTAKNHPLLETLEVVEPQSTESVAPARQAIKKVIQKVMKKEAKEMKNAKPATVPKTLLRAAVLHIAVQQQAEEPCAPRNSRVNTKNIETTAIVKTIEKPVAAIVKTAATAKTAAAKTAPTTAKTAAAKTTATEKTAAAKTTATAIEAAKALDKESTGTTATKRATTKSPKTAAVKEKCQKKANPPIIKPEKPVETEESLGLAQSALVQETEEYLQTNDEDDNEEAMMTEFLQDKHSRPSSLDTSSAGGSSSSIPELSITKIRAVLRDQREYYQQHNYINLTDKVLPGMSRYEFNFRYVHGIARKRFAKHQRASNKKNEDQ